MRGLFVCKTVLPHEKHLARPFDCAVELPLVVRRQVGIFARQNPPLLGDEVFKQGGVFVVQRLHREVNLGFWSWRSRFHARHALIAIGLFFDVCFAWHNNKQLLDFPMHRMAAQKRIVLLKLQFFGLGFFVSSGDVA